LALDGQGEARAETRLRGDYAVWMKPESHLSRVVELNIAESGNLVESTFLAGDADGDNRIGAGDYLLLVQAYRSLAGEANYDVRVDFNRDGHVGAQDFLILVANYGQVGQ
jgi:uncharacterized protein YacL (UPF0231 family)